jgi:hypothetical protein
MKGLGLWTYSQPRRLALGSLKPKAEGKKLHRHDNEVSDDQLIDL